MSSSESSSETHSADHGHRPDRGENQHADRAPDGPSHPIQPPSNGGPKATVAASVTAGERHHNQGRADVGGMGTASPPGPKPSKARGS